MSYKNYLNSKHWKETRQVYREDKNFKCWMCGSKENLQIHHLSYDNLGKKQEENVDLVVLCGKHHKYLHEFKCGKRKKWDRKYGDLRRFKGELNKMTIGKMKREGIKIPIDKFEGGEMKEYAVTQ